MLAPIIVILFTVLLVKCSIKISRNMDPMKYMDDAEYESYPNKNNVIWLIFNSLSIIPIVFGIILKLIFFSELYFDFLSLFIISIAVLRFGRSIAKLFINNDLDISILSNAINFGTYVMLYENGNYDFLLIKSLILVMFLFLDVDDLLCLRIVELKELPYHYKRSIYLENLELIRSIRILTIFIWCINVMFSTIFMTYGFINIGFKSIFYLQLLFDLMNGINIYLKNKDQLTELLTYYKIYKPKMREPV
jgi:hypothetical protein